MFPPKNRTVFSSARNAWYLKVLSIVQWAASSTLDTINSLYSGSRKHSSCSKKNQENFITGAVSTFPDQPIPAVKTFFSLRMWCRRRNDDVVMVMNNNPKSSGNMQCRWVCISVSIYGLAMPALRKVIQSKRSSNDRSITCNSNRNVALIFKMGGRSKNCFNSLDPKLKPHVGHCYNDQMRDGSL